MAYTATLGTISSMLGHVVPGYGIGAHQLGNPIPISAFAPMPLPPAPGPIQPPPVGAPGSVFISPALTPNVGAQIDVASVVAVSRSAEHYEWPAQNRQALRPFITGPAPAAPSGRVWPPDFSASYKPTLNNAQYGLMSNNDPSSAHRGGAEHYGMPGAVYGELEDSTTHEITVLIV